MQANDEKRREINCTEKVQERREKLTLESVQQGELINGMQSD